MPAEPNEERPCLHCLIVDLLDEFYAEHPTTTGETNTIDTDEVIDAVAKTVAELTCKHDGASRQQIIERLTREIMDYDTEFRQEDALGSPASHARH